MGGKTFVAGWRRVGIVAVVLGALPLAAWHSHAHDDVHGRPHCKSVRANPTAVMRALQSDRQSAQALTASSGTACIGGAAGRRRIGLLGRHR